MSKTMDGVLTANDIDAAMEILLRKLWASDPSGRDDGEIEILEKHVDCLQVAFDAVQSRFPIRIAQRRRQRNAVVSIHRLPIELLVSIFELSLDDLPAYTYFRGLALISGVCSAWRATVLSAPSLWAVISNRDPKLLIKTALERSRSCTLKVMDEGRSYGFADIRQQLGEERARIRSLDLQLRGDDEASRAFANGPAPALESLILNSFMGEFDKEEGLDLFKGQAPRLRDISLSGISICWDSAILAMLKSLEMINIIRGGPSMDRMLDILKQIPELARLTLQAVKFSKATFLPIPPQISLPCLKQLRLNDLSPADTIILLEKVQVPACQNLEIKCGRSVPSPLGVPLESITHLAPSVAAIVASQKRTRITIQQNQFEFESRSGVPSQDALGSVSVSLPVQNAKQHLRWLVDLLPRPIGPNAPTISVAFGSGYMFSDPTIFHELGRMNVTDLNLETFSDVDPMIQHLIQPSSIKKTLQWNLPNLRSLRIDGILNEDHLIKMLTSRYRPAEAKTKGGKKGKGGKAKTPKPPASLQLLTFVGGTIEREAFEEVEEIMSPDIVQWEDEPQEDEDEEERCGCGCDDYGYDPWNW